MNFLRRLIREEDAATAVEYAVLLALILMSIIAAIGTVGVGTGGLWSDINTELEAIF
ncbi:MAG: Flp family type IVb pilin [Pirellulaceae bacterium]|nr:Flp family type IVb pilin [Planctomycetales bacterium]